MSSAYCYCTFIFHVGCRSCFSGWFSLGCSFCGSKGVSRVSVQHTTELLDLVLLAFWEEQETMHACITQIFRGINLLVLPSVVFTWLKVNFTNKFEYFSAFAAWEVFTCVWTRAGKNPSPGHFGSGQIRQRTKMTYLDPVCILIRTVGPYSDPNPDVRCPDPNVRILHPLNELCSLFISAFSGSRIPDSLIHIWTDFHEIWYKTKGMKWTHNYTFTQLFTLYSLHSTQVLNWSTQLEK